MFSARVGASALMLAGLLWASPLLAARNVSIAVDPGTSSAGIDPDLTGAVATYQYTIYDGQSISDTIPVDLCMTAAEADWTSIAVTFDSPTGPLPGVAPPADQTFLNGATLPDCRSLSLSIQTGPLVLNDPLITQNFNANLGLSSTSPVPSTGSQKPQVNFVDNLKNIHIKVAVLPAQTTSHVSCFLTDSTGNFLSDCNGAAVTASASSDGRFAIVANKKKIEVATNPGQFYYNLVWLNTTGATQTVDVAIDRVGVVPHGQQALHAAVFNGYLSGLTPVEFAIANDDGIPEGHDDAVTAVEVPPGASLLVTYHLEWGGIGAPVPANCATNCPSANQEIAVTGTVSGSGISSESCTAAAYGYAKK